VDFVTIEGEQILAKVSFLESYQAAQRHLDDENPGWNFSDIRHRAESAWKRVLNRIEIKRGSEHARKLLLYTLSFLFPHFFW